MVLLDLGDEGAEQRNTDLVCAVIIVAVAGEVALNLEVDCEALLVADGLDLGVLDCGERVNYV